jgi:hypothetical protein
MTALPGLPAQRPSPDRRTVVLPDTAALRDALVLAEATGWTPLSACRDGGTVRLVLVREDRAGGR